MARLSKTPLRMVNSDKDASAGMKTPDNSNHSVGITEEEGELLNKVAKTKNLAKISCSTSKKAPKEVAEDIKRIDSKSKLMFFYCQHLFNFALLRTRLCHRGQIQPDHGHRNSILDKAQEYSAQAIQANKQCPQTEN